MKIRILGCHGSEQLHEDVRLPPSKACGFLLNDTVMVDGGTISSQLTFSQQTKIRHVLLSHLHFDHIQGLPSLADNLAEDTAAHVEIASIPEVINGLKHHIFNEAVYPDFFKLPTPDHPILSSRYLESGQTFSNSRRRCVDCVQWRYARHSRDLGSSRKRTHAESRVHRNLVSRRDE
jgi:cAMP phosphodiesterase class-II